jgi:nanoRNase/pAp phosphatase (c-di-AMP/oligoRNAs hydrolase)
MLQYGGGGHLAAGTCQVPHEDSGRVLAEIIAKVGAPMSSPLDSR